jgi:hypothetical protein
MLFFLVLACSTSHPPAEAPVAKPEPAANTFGTEVKVEGAVSADTLVQAADQWTGKKVTVRGTIREVCQKKGCWYTLATGNSDTNIMVKDKEYAIFLPKDVAGREVVVEGTFSVGVMPLEEARHYAQDAGKDPNSITEAPKTFSLDMDGVKLL